MLPVSVSLVCLYHHPLWLDIYREKKIAVMKPGLKDNKKELMNTDIQYINRSVSPQGPVVSSCSGALDHIDGCTVYA